MADYLGSNLWFGYVEPKSLMHGLDVSDLPGPDFSGEDRNEYLKLAKKWDELGLLQPHVSPIEEAHFCKVFNIFKNE